MARTTPARDRPSVADVEALPAATIAAIVAEAASDITEEYRDDVVGAVVYVAPPVPAGCGGGDSCVRLAPVLGLDDALAGHLHHRPDDDVGRAWADPAAALRMLATLIEADVDRDLLDACLARSRHVVVDLRIALDLTRVIGNAVGVLMVTRTTDADGAFTLLEQTSRRQHRTVLAVAAEVQATGALPGEQRGSGT